MHLIKSALVALGIFAIAATSPATAFAPPGLQMTGAPMSLPVAQNNGGSSPKTGYTCSGLQCTCKGDKDCNDMFGSGKCGDVASCEETTGECKCLILKKQGTKNKAPANGAKGQLNTKQN